MRLDVYLFQKNFTRSRSEAQQLIKEGKVTLDSQVVTKPSIEVDDSHTIQIQLDSQKYVSRGGYKLEALLNQYQITLQNCICLDIGASTGGFTDCLLQHGAQKVYALENGSQQLAKKLVDDPRVTSMENVNARFITKELFDQPISVVTMDVSFISQTLIIPQIATVLSCNGIFLSLIKPQFECGKSNLNKKGIVKTDRARADALQNVLLCAKNYHFECIGTMVSPILGGDGNVEYLAYFKKGER